MAYLLSFSLQPIALAQRQALQARRASRRHVLCHYTAFLRRRSEGSETGGVIFGRQLSRRLQAHVGRKKYNLKNKFYFFLFAIISALTPPMTAPEIIVMIAHINVVVAFNNIPVVKPNTVATWLLLYSSPILDKWR
jgi:hypothetical protein